MDYFLGIGAQKAGTTWLHHQLVLHPQVAVPERKEVHYFDMVTPTRSGESFGNYYLGAVRRASRAGRHERVDKLTRVLGLAFQGDEAYRAMLSESATSETRVAGEITPAYACLTGDGFAHARKALDDPAVVFVMRDPLERYWSAVRMARETGDRVHADFRSSITRPNMWARADYPATLELLDAVFPPERVLVLFYEELFTEESLMRVAGHLGVEQRWGWDLELVSKPGQPADLPDPPSEVLDRLLPVYQYARERFGDEVPSTWRY